MNDALARIAGALPRLDRDTLAWGIVPAMSAAMVTALFALPNYARARSLRDESQRLQAESSERISQRNNLALLESNVARLREERRRAKWALPSCIEKDLQRGTRAGHTRDTRGHGSDRRTSLTIPPIQIALLARHMLV